jgi:hypothetical protein
MLKEQGTEGSMRTLLSLTLLAAALCATACGNAYEPGFHPVSATRSLRDIAFRLPPESAEVPLVDLDPVAPAILSITVGPTLERDDWVGPLATSPPCEPLYRPAHAPRHEPRARATRPAVHMQAPEVTPPWPTSSSKRPAPRPR